MKRCVALMVSVGVCVLALVSLKALKPGRQSLERPSDQELLRTVEGSVAPGMSKAEVFRLLGEPADEMTFADGLNFVFYWFLSPIPGSQPNENIVGIELRFSNETVVSWDKIYAVSYGIGSGNVHMDRERRRRQLDVQLTSQELFISLYVVKETPFENARFVSVPELGLEGYMRQEPDLKLHSVNSFQEDAVAVGVQTNRRSVLIHLAERDAGLLRVLTKENVGARLLIAIKDEPVHAPVIRSEIPDGKFYVAGLTGEQASRLGEALEILTRKQASSNNMQK